MQVMEQETQTKSKQRIADHGEVFTSIREVNAMLDLVKQETERIDSRFLEPACGDGNFLTVILKRKLEVVEKRYSKSQIEFERYTIAATGSIYGVDLLQDNVEACRQRLYDIVFSKYNNLFSNSIRQDYLKSVKYILNLNIIWGDALTLKTCDLRNQPITFSEWNLVTGSMIQRRDFKFSTLLENQPLNEPNLFSDLGEQAFIPTPVADYPLMNIYKIAEDVQGKL